MCFIFRSRHSGQTPLVSDRSPLLSYISKVHVELNAYNHIHYPCNRVHALIDPGINATSIIYKYSLIIDDMYIIAANAVMYFLLTC